MKLFQPFGNHTNHCHILKANDVTYRNKRNVAVVHRCPLLHLTFMTLKLHTQVKIIPIHVCRVYIDKYLLYKQTSGQL